MASRGSRLFCFLITINKSTNKGFLNRYSGNPYFSNIYQ